MYLYSINGAWIWHIYQFCNVAIIWTPTIWAQGSHFNHHANHIGITEQVKTATSTQTEKKTNKNALVCTRVWLLFIAKHTPHKKGGRAVYLMNSELHNIYMKKKLGCLADIYEAKTSQAKRKWDKLRYYFLEDFLNLYSKKNNFKEQLKTMLLYWQLLNMNENINTKLWTKKPSVCKNCY